MESEAALWLGEMFTEVHFVPLCSQARDGSQKPGDGAHKK